MGKIHKIGIGPDDYRAIDLGNKKALVIATDRKVKSQDIFILDGTLNGIEPEFDVDEASGALTVIVTNVTKIPGTDYDVVSIRPVK